MWTDTHIRSAGPAGGGKTGASVHGTVEPGFEPVRDAFVGNFEERGEIGAATAIYVGDRKVVDLWGGIADHLTGREWGQDTLSLVWSTTKGPAAMTILRLAERGVIDLDAPVARYWPEFAQNGKAEIPVSMILNHQAGLPYVDMKLSVEDLLEGGGVVDALARQAPVWTPGTRHGYHAITIGYLFGEIVRRVTGTSLGRYFAEEIAAPLGLDFFIGLPPVHESRVSRIIEVDANAPGVVDSLPEGLLRDIGKDYVRAVADPSSPTVRAFQVGGFRDTNFNEARFHAAELPWGNGIGDARSLARLYAACIGEVDGFRLLSEETIDRATISRGVERDVVLIYPTNWSDGFMLSTELAPWMGPTSFGFTGAGGHIGMADREAKVGFAYTMTKMFGNLTGDPRPAAVMEALQRCLA
jgi:CubicO group peptidase (beta-lactamase class C family)